MPEMIPVKKSSNVAAYGLDGDVLTIEYKNGRRYEYSNVSPEIWRTLNEANEINNVGSYVANVIKQGRTVKEVDPTLPRSPGGDDASG